MRARYRGWLALALCGALVALSACGQSAPKLALGEVVPEFRLLGFDGQSIPISAWRGKTVVLNFWASWCRACRDELPSLEKLSGSAGAGLQVAAVSLDDDHNLVQEFLLHGGYRVASYSDAHGQVARDVFDVQALPATVIIGPDGRLMARVSGARDWSDAALLHGLGLKAGGRGDG